MSQKETSEVVTAIVTMPCAEVFARALKAGEEDAGMGLNPVDISVILCVLVSLSAVW